MKRLFVLLFLIFPCIARADTLNLNWIVDGQTYAQTTCTVGGDLTLPTAPTKYGYTFQGWEVPYSRLEYLEGQNGPYINLNYKITRDTVIDVQFVSTGGSWLFGYTEGNSGRWGVAANNATGQLTFYSYKSSITFSPTNIEEICTATFDFTNGVTVNGRFLPFSTTPGADSPETMQIFRAKNSTTNASYRIYYFSIRKAGNLIYNLVPVRRNSDGVVGLYDTLSDTLYTNAGSGTFVSEP